MDSEIATSTQLHLAAWSKDLHIRSNIEKQFESTIRTLIEKGRYDPMAVDIEGTSPLHRYCGPLETFSVHDQTARSFPNQPRANEWNW